MDYYARKAKASMRIDALIKNNDALAFEEVVLLIETEYGLSKKFVFERLKNLHSVGKVMFDGVRVERLI